MNVRKILFTTDIDKPSFATLERMLNIRKLGLEEVLILHSIYLEEWESKFSTYGVKGKIAIEKNITAPRILSIAEKEAVSLIVANFDKKRRGFLVGSITKNLIKGSSIPLLIINRTEEVVEIPNRALFEHVIFATDWSPASENAFRYLLNFKECIKELEIVNVICKKLTVRDLRILKKRLTEIRNVALDFGIDAEYHIYAGKTHTEIMLAAKDYNATIILMGTTRKSTIKEKFVGSSSYRVAEEASVPTLVVP